MADKTLTLQFEGPEVAETFSVDTSRRRIAGLAVPWGAEARSGGQMWRFEPGSLHWTEETRVKLNRDHDSQKTIGVARQLSSSRQGLNVAFTIARGAAGDEALSLAEDQVLDGFSIEVDFDADGYEPDAKGVNIVRSALLRAVALTGAPAFDDARVKSVVASRTAAAKERNDEEMAEESKKDEGQDGGAELRTMFTATLETLVAKQGEANIALMEKQTENFMSLADTLAEQRHKPSAAPFIRFGASPAIYQYGRLGVTGHSLVRDAYYSKFNQDEEARGRLEAFRRQQHEMREALQKSASFTQVTTSNAAEVIPPGYRPDLYVPELFQGRPFSDACSRGVLDNATPFTVPTFTSATATTGLHTEGTNPTDGSLDLSTKTVTPQAYSGILNLSREIVDSANPAIDAIALAAMREEYARDTEARAYTEFNSATLGLGGTITAGFVPSGAQAAVTAGQGDELLAGIRAAFALYPFRRFAAPNRAVMSQEATSALAAAVDSTGRHLLPYVGAMNAVGMANAVQGVYTIDGLPFVPAWSISLNTAADFDVAFWNSADAWVWESPLLTFRYEEKLGPATIQLALFGYYAVHILRPVGLSGIRHTAS